MKPYTQITSGANEPIASFVTRSSGGGAFKDQKFNTIAFFDHRGLKFAALYLNYLGHSISAHVASRPGALWAHPQILYHIFNYPFNQLNCWRITLPISVNNKRAIAMAEAAGFTREGRCRKAVYNGDDAYIYGMLKEECSWIKRSPDGLSLCK